MLILIHVTRLQKTHCFVAVSGGRRGAPVNWITKILRFLKFSTKTSLFSHLPSVSGRGGETGYTAYTRSDQNDRDIFLVKNYVRQIKSTVIKHKIIVTVHRCHNKWKNSATYHMHYIHSAGWHLYILTQNVATYNIQFSLTYIE